MQIKLLPPELLKHRKDRIDLWDPSNEIIVVEPDGESRPVLYIRDIPGVSLQCHAKNCRVVFRKPYNAENLRVDIWKNADGTEIEIGQCGSILSLTVFATATGKFRIGKGCRVAGLEVMLAGGECDIAEDCLISDETLIFTRDTHSIVDPETGQLLNGEAKGVHVGAGSWICRRAMLTKNANIPPHTIVGMGAVVTKTFTEEYTAIGGNPAAVIGKTGRYDNRSELEYIKEYGEAVMHSGINS